MHYLKKPLPLAALCLIAQTVFVYFYLKQERCFHFWDYAMYANMAIDWYSLPSLSALISRFWNSLANTYNLIYAIPSYISFSLFGPSRDVFIVTNTFIFMGAHSVALGFVLHKIYNLAKDKAVLAAFLLSPLVPFLWYPLLQGYPDNGAAACLTFAFVLGLGKIKNWKNAFCFGALIGLAVVLRRHYAYPGFAAAASVFLFQFFDVMAAPKHKRLEEALAVFFMGALSALAIVGTVFVIEPGYFKEMIGTDWATLYKSYEKPASYFYGFTLSRAGLLLSALALAGGAVAFVKEPGLRKPLGMTALFVTLWLLVWGFGPAQAGEHYLISALPLPYIVGLYGLTKLRVKGAALAVPFAVLALNSAHAFYFANKIDLPSEPPNLNILSSARPPWVRKDYDSLVDLARYVSQTTSQSDKIVISGSSFLFNQDLVRSIYTDVLHDIPAALRFLPAPEIDGEQEPPLNAYAAANVFLVPEKAQYHLPPEGQKVITALWTQFPPSGLSSAQFKKDDASFALEDGTRVHIWRRISWNPAALHEALGQIRTITPSSLSWVIQKQALMGIVSRDTNGQAYAAASFQMAPFAADAIMFYDVPLGSKEGRFSTQTAYSPDCSGLRLTLMIQSAGGRILYEKTGVPQQNPGILYVPYQLSTKDEGPFFASVQITTKPTGSCSVALTHMRLEQNEAGGLPNQKEAY